MLLWGRRNIFKGNGRMMLWEKVENNIARTEGKGGTRKVGRRRRMLLRGRRRMLLKKRRRMLLRGRRRMLLRGRTRLLLRKRTRMLLRGRRNYLCS